MNNQQVISFLSSYDAYCWEGVSGYDDVPRLNGEELPVKKEVEYASNHLDGFKEEADKEGIVSAVKSARVGDRIEISCMHGCHYDGMTVYEKVAPDRWEHYEVD